MLTQIHHKDGRERQLRFDIWGVCCFSFAKLRFCLYPLCGHVRDFFSLLSFEIVLSIRRWGGGGGGFGRHNEDIFDQHLSSFLRGLFNYRTWFLTLSLPFSRSQR